MMLKNNEALDRGNDVEKAISKNPLFANFERVGNLRWVSSPTQDIRMIFDFESLKGDTFSARWGWSVDFVPVLNGRRLTGKRNASKAVFDLCIDPIDSFGSIQRWCSFYGYDLSSRVMEAGESSFDRAVSDWDSVRSLSDLADLFEAREKIKFRRFSLHNYTQTSLALGLILFSVGRVNEGQKHLDAFRKEYSFGNDLPALVKAEAEARLIAQYRMIDGNR